jgi:hypothetical protein
VSSISSNVCGNCANFKPRQGDKFFNCTFAKQAGVPYAMQVRADTRSCEAFSAFQQPPKPQTDAKTAVKPPVPRKAAPQSPQVCNWLRLIIVAVLIILIVLIAWGGYSCYSHSNAPTPTPTPTVTYGPTSTATAAAITPTPTPTPTLIPTKVFALGNWVYSTPQGIVVMKAVEQTALHGMGDVGVPSGTYWLVVTITIQNIGDYTFKYNQSNFAVIDSYGLVYHPTRAPLTMPHAFPWGTYDIYPGQLIGGEIYYVVPNIATGMKIQILVNGEFLQWTLGI